MNSEHFIRIGLSRLRHPLPPVKLKAIHSLANALTTPDGKLVWNEYLAAIKRTPLESEAAEALMVAFLGRESGLVNTADLFSSLQAPSPLSDLIYQGISGNRPLFNAWMQSHSGEAPPFFEISESAIAFTKSTVIPRIFRTRLTECERDFGYDFTRQWKYEIDRLISRLGAPSGGSPEYWSGDRENVANVFPRTCHLPRSAFLRTLALAYDLWGIPIERVYEEATYAIPGDFVYAQMLPSERPKWAEMLSISKPSNTTETDSLVRSLLQKLAAEDSGGLLMYLNAPLEESATYRADLRITSCYLDSSSATPKAVFSLHDFFMNPRVNFASSTAHSLNISTYDAPPLPVESGVQGLPAIVPTPMRSGGYLPSDLLHRLPYLPIPHTKNTRVTGLPVSGGLKLNANDVSLGNLHYWNQRWKSGRPQEARSSCGTALVAYDSMVAALAPSLNFALKRFWEITIFEREYAHSEWSIRRLYGAIL